MSAVATARVERPTYTYINLQRAKGSLRQRKRSNAILISGRNSVLVYLERVRIRARSKCGQSDFADISLAEELTECLPEDSTLIADKAYDSSTFRKAVGAKGIKTCIPARSNRTTTVPFSPTAYRRRHRIENFFERIKRYRRVATRYDKLAETFLGFVCLAILFTLRLR